MAATLQLYLLGAFELKYGGEVVTAVDSARVQSLLAYLVLHRSAPQFRQHIAFLFWPDTSEAQARTNLRKVLMLLRRALSDADNYLVMTAKSVQWRAQAPLELDVDRFEQGYAHADSPAQWQAALDLYRGDLMPSCYDEWILPVRERLHQAFVDLCDRLIQKLELSHDYKRAIHYAQRLLRHDPVRESSYRQLMQLYARLGEYSSGLRVYHDCSTVLRREMDVEPNAETQALYQQLLNPTTSRPASLAQSAASLATEISAEISVEISVEIPAETAPIFGRQIEWRALRSLWEKLPPSQPHFVLIAGEAGIGKSRLAEEFLYWVNQRGAAVARTRSWSGEGRIAYAPVTTLLRSDALRPQLGRLSDIWLHQIARLLPEVREERNELPYPDPLHEEWQRQHFYDALARAVTIHNKPLLLLFDDLQWCDQQTLEWLRFLLRSGYDRPLLVIGTARLEEIADNDSLAAMLRNLRQADQITELELSPLNQEDVARLASHMTHRPVESEVAAHLYRKTEGNPLFVIETLRAGLKAEATKPAGAALWMEPLENIPSKIQAVIQARLAQLSPSAQEVAAMAATIGRSFTVAVIAEVWQQDENTLTWGLDELWRRRIVREQGVDAYDFSHDRMREVVYDQLSPTQRRLYHRRVAQAIERLYSADLDNPKIDSSKIDEVSGELGMHFERAGENEKARIYWLRAGNYALESHALLDAIANFERALRLAEKPDQQADAYIGLGRAYFALDEADSVLANVEKAQRLLPTLGPHTAKLLHLQAEVFFARYEIDQAETAALAMQQAAEATDDAEALCQSLSLLGQICSTRGKLDQEVTLITRALSIARQSQNRWREGRTLADLGWLQAQRGDFAQAILAAEQARAILETSGDRAGVAFVWNVLGRAYGGAGNYRAAFAAFRQSQELAATIDHKFLLAQVPNMLGWLHEQLCDYAGALRLDQEGLAVAEQWQKRPAAISARINIATDLRNLGQPQQALTQLQEVQHQIERETFGFHSWRWRLRLLHGEGLCYLALAQPEKAYLLAQEGLALAQSTTSRKYLALNLALLGMAQAQIGLVGKAIHDAAKLHEAMAALTSAVDLADEISYQPLRWEGRWHLATAAAALGQYERALALLRSADQIISSIADGLDSVPLRSLFLTSAPVQAIFQALQSLDG